MTAIGYGVAMFDPAPGPLPWDGHCRCDAVRFRVVAAPIATAVCHCRGCQRMSSSAFSLTLMAPTGGVEITRGELVPGGLPGGDLKHRCCDRCKTWVMTEIEAFGLLNVRAALLDDAGWFVPFLETYRSTKLAWVTTPAVERFDEFPEPALYPQLLADYRAWARARGWPVG